MPARQRWGWVGVGRVSFPPALPPHRMRQRRVLSRAQRHAILARAGPDGRVGASSVKRLPPSLRRARRRGFDPCGTSTSRAARVSATGTPPGAAPPPATANVIAAPPPADVANGATSVSIVGGRVNCLLIGAPPLSVIRRRPRAQRGDTAAASPA